MVADLCPDPLVPFIKGDAEGRGIACIAFLNQIGITR